MPYNTLYPDAECGPISVADAILYHTGQQLSDAQYTYLVKALGTTHQGTTSEAIESFLYHMPGITATIQDGPADPDLLRTWISTPSHSLIMSYIDDGNEWHYAHFRTLYGDVVHGSELLTFDNLVKCMQRTDSLIFIDSSDTQHLTYLADMAGTVW